MTKVNRQKRVTGRYYGRAAWEEDAQGDGSCESSKLLSYNHPQTRGRRGSGAGCETFARLKWSSDHAVRLSIAAIVMRLNGGRRKCVTTGGTDRELGRAIALFHFGR
jgi:hypothetical protein